MEKLRKAVQKGSVEDVRALVLTGADVNALDKKGRKQREQIFPLPVHLHIEGQLRVSRVLSYLVVWCLRWSTFVYPHCIEINHSSESPVSFFCNSSFLNQFTKCLRLR